MTPNKPKGSTIKSDTSAIGSGTFGKFTDGGNIQRGYKRRSLSSSMDITPFGVWNDDPSNVSVLSGKGNNYKSLQIDVPATPLNKP